MPATSLRQSMVEASQPEAEGARVFAIPFAERIGRTAIVAGTFDTKGRELNFIRDRLKALGIPTRTVDLSTSGKPSTADVTPLQVASMHPRGSIGGVFIRDRGRSVTAMAEAFARWIAREPRIGGIISAGGSGGTTLATAGMRALPVGIPKVMVSTVAAGDVRDYVGATDIVMFHSVADVQGLNSITEQVLANAAHALAGMIAQMPTREAYEAKRKMSPAGARHHHVRRHHAVRAGGDPAARGRLRLPRFPRHRHRRAGHGSARRFRPARRLPRPHHHRGRRHAGRRHPRRPTRIGSARRSAPACPMSARPARSTWLISARATPCRRSSDSRKFVIHNAERDADAHDAR